MHNPESTDVSRTEILTARIISLGNENPVGMTREDFLQSPAILYHGSKKDFRLNQQHAYDGEDQNGSSTLGEGFYATDSLSEAEEYARIRSKSFTDVSQRKGFIKAILPYRAKMLDMRTSEDSLTNLPFPAHLIPEWKDFVWKNYLEKGLRDYEGSDSNRVYEKFATLNYLAQLDTIERLSIGHLQLRDILGTGDMKRLLPPNFSEEALLSKKKYFPAAKQFAIYDGVSMGGDYCGLFTTFMQSKGIDGVILNEGGEGKSKGHTSFTFYNYECIGDYEAWNPECSHVIGNTRDHGLKILDTQG